MKRREFCGSERERAERGEGRVKRGRQSGGEWSKQKSGLRNREIEETRNLGRRSSEEKNRSKEIGRRKLKKEKAES